MRPSIVAAFLAALLSAVVVAQQPAPAPAAAPAPAPAPKLTDAQIEQFLLHAKVVKTHSASKGVTASLRATLKDGTMTHDAQIQAIDEHQQQFNGSAGGVEFDFKDTWAFNVAGYRVDRLIGMNMVPVSVERKWDYHDAAFTWWIDDVVMDEQERLKRKQEPPDVVAWNQQMQMMRTFDELIANIDRNLGNLIITSDWRLWPIDHTRAFRTNHECRPCRRRAHESAGQGERAPRDVEIPDHLPDRCAPRQARRDRQAPRGPRPGRTLRSRGVVSARRLKA